MRHFGRSNLKAFAINLIRSNIGKFLQQRAQSNRRQKRLAAAAGLPAKAPAAIRTTNDPLTEGVGQWLTLSFFYKLKA